MRIVLNEDEQSLLGEVSLEALRLYVLAVRPVVDIHTGIVGRGFPVSRSRLAIEAQYVPPQGSRRPPWKASLKEVDSLVDELERVGLVKRVATPQEIKKLVLKLSVMDVVGRVRPESEGDMSRQHEPDSQKSAASHANEGLLPNLDVSKKASYQQGEPDISEYRGIKQNHSGAISNITHFAQAREERAAAGRGRISQVVQLLGKLGTVASPASHDVANWVAQGVSDAVLTEACGIAAQRRAQQGSTQPISPAYLAPIVDDVVKRNSSAPGSARRVSSDGKSESRPAGGKTSWRAVPPREVHAAAPVVTMTGPALGDVDYDWVE